LSEGFVNNIAEGKATDGTVNDINSNSILEVKKYEKEGSLLIMDSVKAYFDSDNNYKGKDSGYMEMTIE
jgi:hypothetical protein